MAIRTQIRLLQLSGTLDDTVAAADVVDASSLQGVLDGAAAAIKRITGASSFTSAATGAFSQTITPDSAGGQDLGTAALEWGDLYIGNDKGIKFGPGQESTITESGGGLVGIFGGNTSLAAGGTLYVSGAGGARFGDDTGYIAFDGAGAVSTSGITTTTWKQSGAGLVVFGGAGGSTIASSNALYVSGAGGARFGDDTGYISFDGSGNVAETGMGTLTLAPSTVSIKGDGSSTFGDDTGYINFGGTGALTQTGITTMVLGVGGASAISSNSTLYVSGAGGARFGDDTGYVAFDGTGAVSTTGATTIDIDGTGIMSLNSSLAAINIGNDDVDAAINIGTQGERTVSIGNETGVTALDFDAGTGGVAIDAQGAGTIVIGGETDTGGIGIGTGASARTITIGHASSTATNINGDDITLTSVDDLTLTDGTATVLLGGAGAFSLAAATTWSLDGTSTATLGATAFDIDADGGAGNGTIAIDTNDTTNGLKLATATSGVPISIGHATSEVTVNDNMTVTGDLTVNGTLTKIDTNNLVVKDPIIGMANGAQSPNTNGGIVLFSGSNTSAKPDLVLGRVDDDTWGAGMMATNSGSVTSLATMTLVNMRASRFEIDGANDYIDVSTNVQVVAAAGIDIKATEDVLLSASGGSALFFGGGAGAAMALHRAAGDDQYLNFNSSDATEIIQGAAGFGFRNDSGTLEFKNSGGAWTTFGGGVNNGKFAVSAVTGASIAAGNWNANPLTTIQTTSTGDRDTGIGMYVNGQLLLSSAYNTEATGYDYEINFTTGEVVLQFALESDDVAQLVVTA